MAITRIEVAIECDDPIEDGMHTLAVMLRAIGLTTGDMESDVEVILTSTDSGTPVLVAVVQKSDDESDES
jgi:hypothetical protein